MLFGKYLFSINFVTEAILPPYKGSTIRGVLGYGLKRVCCIAKNSKCPECILRTRCVYAFLFEKPIFPSENSSRSGNFPASPRPYVIEPELSRETYFNEGDLLSFNLLLFGKANEYLPYIIYALVESGKKGMGRLVQGKRGKFRLSRVFLKEKKIYANNHVDIHVQADLSDISLGSCPGISSGASSMEIEFVTPFRTKHLNRLSASIPFHVLIRACLRRISSLMLLYGEGEPELDYKGLVERAISVEMIDSSIRWYDWRRYSNRQHKGMFLGGIKGKATYKGDLSEFLPIIRLAEILHVGKQTTFGLGKIRVIRTC